MNSKVAGIDLGERESFSTYIAQDGDLRGKFSFSMNPDGYARFSEKIQKETRIAFEASGSAYVVSNELKSMGYDDITVADLRKLPWIIKSKRKNDRVDSLRPAKLHLVGLL